MVSGTVTFDGAPPAGTINLGIGQPSADLLRVDLLRRASESFFSEAHPFELNYGVLAGDERFLESLAGYLGEGYDATVSPESLFVTAGSSQALDFVCTVFCKAGDTVFVEEPSYYLAFQIFRDHELRVVGVPIDENGMRIDALEALLKENNPAFLYIIPSYHNPSGHCMSTERRVRLIELSQQHGFLIVADEVYQLLFYFDDDVDTAAFRERAGELQTGFQPGSLFSSDGKLRNFLRLSFSHYDEDDIREGIARMRPILD